MDLANQKRELQQQGEQQEGTAQRVKELEIEMISAYQALARVAEDVQDLRKQGHACDVDELQSWVSALAQLRPALGPHTHALTLYPLSTWLPLHPPPSPSTSPSPPLRLQLPPSKSPNPTPLQSTHLRLTPTPSPCMPPPLRHPGLPPPTPPLPPDGQLRCLRVATRPPRRLQTLLYPPHPTHVRRPARARPISRRPSRRP